MRQTQTAHEQDCRRQIARLGRIWPRLSGRHVIDEVVAAVVRDRRLTADDVRDGVSRLIAEHESGYAPVPHDIVAMAHVARRDRLEREENEAGVEYPLSRVAIHGRRCSRPGCHGALELLPERMLWCERCQSVQVVEKVDGKPRVILSEAEAADLTYGTPGEPAKGNTLVTREQMDELMARIAAATFRVGRS
jgi:hypothetical protein